MLLFSLLGINNRAMKIIHTSDWHLGQNFMGKSRASEHRAFLSWLLKQIEQHRVDALIVAGDIFDTGSPPSYAREMYNRFIVDIQGKNCTLVILGGNHDSVAMLNESKALLACLNTHVIAAVTEDSEQQIILLNTRKGRVGAILCAIPFLRQRDVLQSKAGQSGIEKQRVMQQAIADYYQACYQKAEKIRDKYGKTLPIIATGHLVTVGAKSSESVRDIYIGTLDAFPATAFPPVDYMALGHIHKPQLVAKSEHICYSGSPIALSFDETTGKQPKSVVLAEFKKGKLVQTKTLEIPCFQPMAIIKGDLKAIEKKLVKLLKSSKLNDQQTIWLEIEVTSQDYLNDLQIRLQQMVAELPVEVLLLRRGRKNKQPAIANEEKETLNELSIEDVFARRLNEEVWETEEDQQRVERLKISFKQVVDELKN
jgi:exonuclease SbcD